MTDRPLALTILGVFVIFAIGLALQRAIERNDTEGVIVTAFGAIALVGLVLLAGKG